MPNLSNRAHTLPASPIRKLAPFADAAKKKGIKVFHLNIGQPDIPTPPQFFQAIQNANLDVLSYSPSPGYDGLRQAIANYYAGIGHEISTDEVLVTTGASEALNFILAATLNTGDEVIIPEPFYANYLSFCQAYDAKVVPIATHLEDNFALPSIAAFEEKITDRTRAIMICNPGNPTGILYPQQSLEQLRQICLKHNLFLISDEVYREFTYDGLQHHSVLGLDGISEHAIVVDSISKRFSACGARIGCVISKNQALIQAIMKMAQARLSPPTFGQIGAEAVYSLPPEYYQGIVQEYSERRDTLKQALSEIEGVVCPEINGAFYAMVGLPVEDADDFCRWMLEEFQYLGQTVMLAPGAGFYSTQGSGKNQVRIAYVLKKDDLKDAMTVLAEGLKAYNAG